MLEVIEYLQEDGESPFSVWLDALTDRKAQAKIDARLARLRLGLLGEASHSQMVCGSYAWILVPAIGCITHKRGGV